VHRRIRELAPLLRLLPCPAVFEAPWPWKIRIQHFDLSY
jgi:hypothetical protein